MTEQRPHYPEPEKQAKMKRTATEISIARRIRKASLKNHEAIEFPDVNKNLKSSIITVSAIGSLHAIQYAREGAPTMEYKLLDKDVQKQVTQDLNNALTSKVTLSEPSPDIKTFRPISEIIEAQEVLQKMTENPIYREHEVIVFSYLMNPGMGSLYHKYLLQAEIDAFSYMLGEYNWITTQVNIEREKDAPPSDS